MLNKPTNNQKYLKYGYTPRTDYSYVRQKQHLVQLKEEAAVRGLNPRSKEYKAHLGQSSLYRSRQYNEKKKSNQAFDFFQGMAAHMVGRHGGQIKPAIKLLVHVAHEGVVRGFDPATISEEQYLQELAVVQRRGVLCFYSGQKLTFRQGAEEYKVCEIISIRLY